MAQFSGKIRLSVPFWGDAYLARVLNLTLPALLAPGNLPALAEQFDVEIALVAESRFFGVLRDSVVFRRLQEHADVKVVPLDDLLTNVGGDYGPVLTFALIRGYEDLGERMLDYFLMFLNADFILADGSYRTVARLVKEGHQVIHCPSFRALLEDVMPELEQRVRKQDGILAVPPRDLVALALRHKHITVKARIVNQKLYHQRYMDQLYWYVDEQTLIGYQWPVALVGLRPERVVTKPVLMFDYGFIPEICPTAKKHFIADSDDCFMLEPEKRASGQNEIRLGWTKPDAIAAYLADYSTKEQRECGEQMHVFHSGDLPRNLDAVAAESREFLLEITSRLGPPKPHDQHPMFTNWWREVMARMERNRASHDAEEQRLCAERGASSESATAPAFPVAFNSRSGTEMAAIRSQAVPVPPLESTLRSKARVVFRRLFGNPGQLKLTHPLWIETHLLGQSFFNERASSSRILWVSEANTTLRPLAELADIRLTPRDLRRDTPLSYRLGNNIFDACFFDLAVTEGVDFLKMYERVRPHMRSGGHVYLSVVNLHNQTPEDVVTYCETMLPDIDISEPTFTGGRLERAMRGIYTRATSLQIGRHLRATAIAVTLLALAPFVYLANRRSSRHASFVYVPQWLNMFACFTVVRRESNPSSSIVDSPDTPAAHDHPNS